MSATLSELAIQDLVRLELGRYPGELVLWRNNCGVAEARGKKIRFGIGNPGGSDLLGLYRGAFVAIEIKTPIGRLSDEQKRFAELVRATGGVFAVIRSVEDAQAWLADMRARYSQVQS